MRYDGPFEIMEKVSPVAYRLRMPASYRIHPVINIAHLESYEPDDNDAGDRTKRNLQRLDFEDLPEFEVEAILGEKMVRRNRKKAQKQYRVRFIGYGPEFDEWLTANQLRNAPDVLRHWGIQRQSAKQPKRGPRESSLDIALAE